MLLVIRQLLFKLTKLNRVDLWQKTAQNLKGVIVERPLPILRLKEYSINRGQYAPLIDISQSDCVQYAKFKNPLPMPQIQLPLHVLQNLQQKTDTV